MSATASVTRAGGHPCWPLVPLATVVIVMQRWFVKGLVEMEK